MTDRRVLCGPLAAVILAAGILGLALLVPGYSQIRQSVSEIGEMDSPARIPFAIMLCGVALCLLIFAAGVGAESKKSGHGPWCAYLIACMALCAAGVGLFAYPHPKLVAFSWIFFALIWISIAANFCALDRHSAFGSAVAPVYGLMQRSLFAAWFGWSAGLGALLWQRKPS